MEEFDNGYCWNIYDHTYAEDYIMNQYYKFSSDDYCDIKYLMPPKMDSLKKLILWHIEQNYEKYKNQLYILSNDLRYEINLKIFMENDNNYTKIMYPISQKFYPNCYGHIFISGKNYIPIEIETNSYSSAAIELVNYGKNYGMIIYIWRLS